MFHPGFKAQAKRRKKKINFSSSNDEFQDKEFSTVKLRLSLNRANDTAEGPDNYLNTFLLKVSLIIIFCELEVFNSVGVRRTL